MPLIFRPVSGQRIQSNNYSSNFNENLNRSQLNNSQDQNQNVVYIEDVSEEKRRALGPKAALSLRWPNSPGKNCTIMARTLIQTTFRSEVEAVASAIALDIAGTDTLIIKSRSRYAVAAFTSWSKNWVQNGWKTTKNTDVKHRDVFERGLQHLRDRPGRVIFVLVSDQTPIEDIIDNDLSNSLSCIRLDGH